VTNQVIHQSPYVGAGLVTFSISILAGPGSGRIVACRRLVTLLGSRSGCKFNLRHPLVAPVHAAIVNNGTELILRDLVSPGGTTLNGLPCEHERLRDGDVFTVGPWELRIRIHATPERRQDADLHPISLDPTPDSIVLEHVQSGRLLQPRREVSVIGRRSGCDIVINDPQVSRCHAVLCRYMDHPVLYDVSASEFVRVGDKPTGFQQLRDQDDLFIGATHFRVRLHQPKSRNGGNGRAHAAARPALLTAQDAPADLIDIRAAEANKRWVVAEHLEQAQRGEG